MIDDISGCLWRSSVAGLAEAAGVTLGRKPGLSQHRVVTGVRRTLVAPWCADALRALLPAGDQWVGGVEKWARSCERGAPFRRMFRGYLKAMAIPVQVRRQIKVILRPAALPLLRRFRLPFDLMPASSLLSQVDSIPAATPLGSGLHRPEQPQRHCAWPSRNGG